MQQSKAIAWKPLKRLLAGGKQWVYEKIGRSRSIVACSNCFTDFGLRQIASEFGVSSTQRCPSCKTTTGKKLSREALEEACHSYFVAGSRPTGRGIFASQIQCNNMFGSSDLFGTESLNSDLTYLEREHGIYCFYNGPPLWQFGKPWGEDGNVDWSMSDFDYIIENCPSRTIVGENILYRAQRNVPEMEICDGRFCSPPESVQTSWRFDSDDTPICYAAFDVETCLHESRVVLSDDIFVAVMAPKRPLRMLDLSECNTPPGVTPFEDPKIWLLALLYASEASYEVCRKLAKRIRERAYDGFIYTSYFQQASERPHLDVAIFGRPIRDGLLEVTSINKVVLRNVAYDWQFGPVVKGAYVEETEASSFGA